MKVLFVCMGNICRSPAGEGIFKKLVDDQGLSDRIEVDSCGIIDYHSGEPADSRMRQAAIKRGYQLDSIARGISKKDLSEFDYILIMDESNHRGIKSLDPNGVFAAKVKFMTEYHPDDSITKVPDPYYGGEQGFEHVLDILEISCQNLLDDITEKLNAG